MMRTPDVYLIAFNWNSIKLRYTSGNVMVSFWFHELNLFTCIFNGFNFSSSMSFLQRSRLRTLLVPFTSVMPFASYQRLSLWLNPFVWVHLWSAISAEGGINTQLLIGVYLPVYDSLLLFDLDCVSIVYCGGFWLTILPRQPRSNWPLIGLLPWSLRGISLLHRLLRCGLPSQIYHLAHLFHSKHCDELLFSTEPRTSLHSSTLQSLSLHIWSWRCSNLPFRAKWLALSASSCLLRSNRKCSLLSSWLDSFSSLLWQLHRWSACHRSSLLCCNVHWHAFWG